MRESEQNGEIERTETDEDGGRKTERVEEGFNNVREIKGRQRGRQEVDGCK